MKCDRCGQPAPRLTHDGNDWICYNCVPANIWAMYPPEYRAQAQTTMKRSELARRNFHKGEQLPQ